MGPKTKMVFSRIILVSLVSPLPLLYSLGLLQRSAARIETAGDSEELLARVVGPTSSSFFLPVAGKGHIPCLENVTEHPTPGAILEVDALGQRNRCNDGSRCAQCLANQDCPTRESCRNYSCVLDSECSFDSDCFGAQECRFGECRI